jgi:SAM-dependent methyltransferase
MANHEPASAPYTGGDILEALTEARRYNDWQARRVAEFFPAGDPLTDFGAGIGTFAKLLRARGRQVRCVEPDAALAEKLRAAGFQVSATLGGCADGSLPALYTLNVLEHIEHDAETLAEIFQKLKPGGKLLVYVPALPALWTSLDDKVKHFRRYRRRELREKLRDAGFDTVRVRHADSLGALAALTHRWFFDKGDGGVSPHAIRFYDRFLFPLSAAGDTVCGNFFGKNLLATAMKPEC